MEHYSISAAKVIIHEAREHSQQEADSEDTVFFLDEEGRLLMGVLDGCGGSGAERYPQLENRTGAQIGAITAAAAIAGTFEKMLPDKQADWTAEHLADSFSTAAYHDLAELKNALPETKTVVSRLRKTFPATAAFMYCEREGGNRTRICSFWAGDSRTYILSADGLKQTSEDDIQGNGDPFDCMENDDVLSKVLCADRKIKLRVKEHSVEGPCIVLCVSDGCYSGLQSPMLLEDILLQTMMQSTSPLAWQRALKAAFGESATDDYSMTLSIVGFQSFPELQKAYLPRHEEFQDKYKASLAEALANQDRDAHKAIWDQYKQEYMVS